MNDDDAVLLRRYAEERSEAAFAQLVRRHLDLVYGAALRRTSGDVHHARDVAQQVFTTLAQQARKLSRHTVLSAWLHTATRNAALNLMISEQRRKTREGETIALAPATDHASSADWEQLRPMLDTAIDELPETDRAAVVLRFLERKPFSQIGAALHISEDAARMRTERALEKLRTRLVRRGITSTATVLGTIVSNQPLISAPAELAASLASVALAGAGPGTGMGGIVTFLMASKTTGIAVVTAIAAFVGGMFFGQNRAALEPLPPAPELPEHSRTIAALRKENQRLRTDVDQLHAANAKLTAERKSPLPVAATPLVTPAAAPAANGPADALTTASQQKAVMNNLRMLSSARAQFIKEYNRAPSSLQELVGADKYIKQMVSVDGEDYSHLLSSAGPPWTVITPSGVTITYDPTGGQTTKIATPPLPPGLVELRQRMEPLIKTAVEAYRTAHDGQPPKNPEDIIPYFGSVKDGADFIEALGDEYKAKR